MRSLAFRSTYLLALSFSLGSVACDRDDAVGTEATLRLGERAELQVPDGGPAVGITYEALEEDSYCRPTMDCFWLGRVVVDLRPDGRTPALRLGYGDLAAGSEPATASEEVVVGGVRLRIVDLDYTDPVSIVVRAEEE